MLKDSVNLYADAALRLNSPPGERVEHDRTRLMYRYARSREAPFDLVELVYNEFKSAMTQNVVFEPLFPLTRAVESLLFAYSQADSAEACGTDMPERTTSRVTVERASGRPVRFSTTVPSSTAADRWDAWGGAVSAEGEARQVGLLEALGEQPRFGDPDFLKKAIKSGEKAPQKPWDGADTLEWTHLPTPAPYHTFETAPAIK